MEPNRHEQINKQTLDLKSVAEGDKTQENAKTNDNSLESESGATETTSTVSERQLDSEPIDLQGNAKSGIELSDILSSLKSITDDLAKWKTQELVDKSGTESPTESSEQEANCSANELMDNNAKLVKDPRFRRRIDELASRLNNLVEDFQEETARIQPKSKDAPKLGSKPSEDPPFQTVLFIDPTGLTIPPIPTALSPGHPPAPIIPSVRMPDETECTAENWRDFLPFRDLLRSKQNGFAMFEIQDEVQLVDIPIAFVLDQNMHVFHIYSPYIQQQIRKIVDVEKYFDVELRPSYIGIRRPFAPIYHHLHDMKQLILEDPAASKSDKSYFMALYHFFESGPGHKPFQNIRTMINEGLIYYEYLWALFIPKEYAVIKDDLGNYQVMQIMSIEWQEDKGSNAVIRHRWYLKSIRVIWTGGKYQKLLCSDRLEIFKGSKLIRDLPFYPLSHHPEHDKLAEIARESGRNWKSYYDEVPKVMSYQGKAQRMQSGSHTTMIDTSVVVDREASRKISEHRSVNDYIIPLVSHIFPNENDLTPNDINTENFSEEDYLICITTVPVFNLDDNEWYIVDVGKLRTRMWRPESFDRLVFDPVKKGFLKHLTGSDVNGRKRYSRDAIEGKGKGIVLLLYGPPGVGKTMTAEVLSEFTRKPLLKVHLGKLADHPNWEQSLEHTFTTAESWDAILLIDEAEIVLEKRTFERMTQNSWISVFLRKLEYYKGLIILTTNLINNIDEAFESRISYPVQFSALTREDRKTIWKDFINDLTMLPYYKKDLLAAVDIWADAEINGRQIRNIITMAQNLASSNDLDGRLTTRHMDDILNVILEFSGHNRKSIAKKKKDQFTY